MGIWQTRLAKAMHWSLYTLLVLQPILGISQAMFITEYDVVAFGVMDYSSLAAADEDRVVFFHVLHSINATVLSVLVLCHIAAGLYHHFYQKDNVLKRMLPYGKV